MRAQRHCHDFLKTILLCYHFARQIKKLKIFPFPHSTLKLSFLKLKYLVFGLHTKLVYIVVDCNAGTENFSLNAVGSFLLSQTFIGFCISGSCDFSGSFDFHIQDAMKEQFLVKFPFIFTRTKYLV